MFLCRVKRGNAVVPYHVLSEQQFHTELAAQLFGRMSCADDLYTYWVYEKVA